MTEQLDDAALLARYRGGDERAFDALVDRWGSAIKGYAIRMLGSRDQAEDIFVETFVRAAAAEGPWESRGTVRAWLFTIARRLCIDVLRRRKVEREARRGLVHLADLRGADPSPEARAILGEQAAGVEAAIAALRPEHREVLLLRAVHGLSERETAGAVGRTVPQVRSQLHYARSRVRELLARSERDARRRLRRRSAR